MSGKIDLVLWAANFATLVAFARAHPSGAPLLINGHSRSHWDYCPWAGTGKFMTAKGTYDGNGDEVTPPTFLSGEVHILRIYSQFFANDTVSPQDPDYDADTQDGRSKIAKYIKDNGTSGTLGSWPYYELDGVRIFRPSDVDSFLALNDLPGHEWVGGNEY